MSPLPVILLVDDDEMHLLIAQRAIARAELPVEVRLAGSGGEALRQLGLHPGATGPASAFALMLLDIGLPDMSGWDVLKRVRECARLRPLPVVVVSSSDRPEDVRRGYELGANSYVVKRHEVGRPGGYLAEAARYWVMLNSAPTVPD